MTDLGKRDKKNKAGLTRLTNKAIPRHLLPRAMTQAQLARSGRMKPDVLRVRPAKGRARREVHIVKFKYCRDTDPTNQG